MYIAIDRKLEQGLEIQNAACGRSDIILRLLLVKSGADHVDEYPHDSAELHGAEVSIDRASPWANTKRLVCADSYFASVPAADLLYKNGLKFVGPVKTSTKKFPITNLVAIELEERGDISCLVRRRDADIDLDLVSFVSMDRERRNFVASGSSMAPGNPQERERWRQVDKDDPNAEADKVELKVAQPQVYEDYYTACGMGTIGAGRMTSTWRRSSGPKIGLLAATP